MTRFSRYFEISLVVIVMAIHLYAALSEAHNFATSWFIRDDAYYYFKVAQNISEGLGSTFDGINPTNGYHPLWMLVCIPIFALARFDLILPLRVLLLVSAAVSAWTGVLLFRLVKRTLAASAAVLAAAYWVFDRSIHYNVTQFGLETGLTALTLTAFLLAISNLKPDSPLSPRQSLTLGLLAVAMTFSRLDTVFLALLAGAWILLRGTPLRARLMGDAAVIVCAAFVSVAARTGLPAYFTYARSAVVLAALGLAIQIPIFYFAGLYASRPPTSNLQLPVTNLQLRFVAASLLGSALAASLMIGLLSSDALSGLPRSALPVYAGIVLVGAGLVRALARSHPEKVGLDWRRIFREGLVYYGILGGALAAYMLFNKWMFGTFTPVSGQIKAWWGSLQGSTYGNPISTWTEFLGLGREEGTNAWGPVMVSIHNLSDRLGGRLWLTLGLLSIAVLLIFLLNRKRAARAAVSLGLPLLLTGSLAQMFYYNGQGYAGSKDWYWVSQMLMFALLGALLFDLLTRPLRGSKKQENFNANNTNEQIAQIEKSKFAPFAHSRNSRLKISMSGKSLAWALASILVLACLVPFATTVIKRMPWGAARAGQPYMDVLPFLESNTEAGALIGMTGGGNTAYFIEGRAIVNMDGLINSYDYHLALRAGRGGDYMSGVGLDYIFSNPNILQNAPYNGQFDKWSLRVSEFGKKDLLKYQP
ncbi:MAG: hypothetical protein H3C52_04760 [Anaerolineales bacterium]|nr:hypothetical protein [Anaerolineales bacterium]